MDELDTAVEAVVDDELRWALERAALALRKLERVWKAALARGAGMRAANRAADEIIDRLHHLGD